MIKQTNFQHIQNTLGKIPFKKFSRLPPTPNRPTHPRNALDANSSTSQTHQLAENPTRTSSRTGPDLFRILYLFSVYSRCVRTGRYIDLFANPARARDGQCPCALFARMRFESHHCVPPVCACVCVCMCVCVCVCGVVDDRDDDGRGVCERVYVVVLRDRYVRLVATMIVFLCIDAVFVQFLDLDGWIYGWWLWSGCASWWWRFVGVF